MNCREMESVLPGLAEREGTPRVALEAARHLASCTACAQALLRLRALAGLLDRLPKTDVPSGFARRVLRALPRKGSAVMVLALLLVSASWGAAFSAGISLAALSSALGSSFEAATSALSVGLRIIVGLMALLRDSASAWPEAPSSLFGFLPLAASHVIALLFFAGLMLAGSGAVLGRGAVCLGRERKQARRGSLLTPCISNK